MTTAPSVTLPVIGHVRSPLVQKFGTPRQPNLVNVPAVIEFVPPFGDPLAFEGLSAFSHIWLLWQFHHNRDESSVQQSSAKPRFRAQVRPPRLGGNQKIGVFATRSMYRPANIGLSVVQLAGIEVVAGEVRLHILGGDMVDGTPILDIKPYISYSDSISHAQSGFAEHKPEQKQVVIQPQVFSMVTQLLSNGWLQQADIDIITELLAQDPRPAYRQQECETLFTMRYQNLDIEFQQTPDNKLQWVGVKLL